MLSMAASHAPVRSPPQRARAARRAHYRVSRAGPDRGPRALCWPRPSQAARALRRPAASALCHWAAGGFDTVAFDLYFYIF
jgi:hypothetical protein